MTSYPKITTTVDQIILEKEQTITVYLSYSNTKKPKLLQVELRVNKDGFCEIFTDLKNKNLFINDFKKWTALVE